MSADHNDAERRERFLARWSRRKLDPAIAESAVDAAPAGNEPREVAGQPASAEAAPELPALNTLNGLESDYRAFMETNIDPATRSNALKKLFSDPHFNVMDGLDTYIDDYSIEDPIPDALLRTLNQARTLLLFEADENDPLPAVIEPQPEALQSSPPAPLPAPAAGASTPPAVEAVPDESPARRAHDIPRMPE